MNFSLPLQTAARTLLEGGVIAYPTEGVFGLGCMPDDELAVARILSIKGRRADAGLILIAGELEQLEPWICLQAVERERLHTQFSHPVTWVVTAAPQTPDWLTGGRDTVAVRISDHPTVRKLCQAADSALVSTSANRTGRPAARSALQAQRFLGSALDQIVSGALGDATGPSEIRVALSDAVIRPYIATPQA